MPFTDENLQKFEDLQAQLRNVDQLRRQANGGNSIIFSYPPHEESLYIEKACEVFPQGAAFIDISRLFVDYIDSIGWEEFKNYYQGLQPTPHTLFKSDDENTDLFDMIIKEISDAVEKKLLPILIRTGCLHGTGIKNLNIMEHRTVMNHPKPLVIFYPSRIEESNLYFLNFEPASKYRGILVK
jgi:hypothetical protein